MGCHGRDTSQHVLIIFLDLFYSVSSMDGDKTITGEEDFDIILD